MTVHIPFKLRSVLVAGLFLAAPLGANATPVLHEGAIFNASGGGVSFSSLHTSTDGMGHGSNIGSISGDVAYTWETGGGNLATERPSPLIKGRPPFSVILCLKWRCGRVRRF